MAALSAQGWTLSPLADTTPAMHNRALLLALAATSFAAPPEPKFKPVTLDSAIQIGYGVAVADVDGDKAPDVLLADKKQYVWYRNPGPAKATDSAAWTKHILAENLTEKDNVCLAAEDTDGDGKCEIAVGAEWNPADTEKSGAVFYLIPPADRTQPWEAVKFPAVEPTTHRMKWIRFDEQGTHGREKDASSAKKAEWGLVVVPLHGRGNKNGEGAPVKVLCYRKPADVRSEWKSEVANESLHMTHNFDGGRLQPMRAELGFSLGGKEGVVVVSHSEGQWTSSPLSRPSADPAHNSIGVGEIRSGRVKDTGFTACIEPMHGNELVIYRYHDLPLEGRLVRDTFWTRTRLTDQLADGHALACGDVLGTKDGDQIVVGWRGNPKQPRPVGIKLFTPLDDKGDKWRESLIDDNEMACEDLVLADLNADGKLDIVASGRATKNVKLYFNETAR